VNTMGEASTANPGGRRGERAPGSAGTASKRRLVRTPRVVTHTEGHTSPSVLARKCRSAGVLRPWQAGREARKNVGSPRRSWVWTPQKMVYSS